MVTSPYRRGADDGFIFGLYLSLMFFGIFASAHWPVLGLLSLLLIVCVPLVIFLFMRRYDRELQGCVTFPMFWMHGMMTFICAILISGAFFVIYLTWIEPDWFFNQLQGVVEAATLPAAKGTSIEEFGKIASEMIEFHMIPSPVSIMFELLMLAIVTGSLLSILLGCIFIIRRRIASPSRKKS